MSIFESTMDFDKMIREEEIIREGNRKKEKKKKAYSGDEYFLMKKRGMIRNPEYRRIMGGISTVYEYIWANIVRDKMYNDRYNIKENYYDKGFLAYCSTYNHIAKECFMDKNTIQRYMEKFESIGAIKILKVGVKPSKRDKMDRIIDRRPSVFILGTWKKTLSLDNKEIKQENYYLDDIFYE